MNSTSLAETDCRNGIINFRLLFFLFSKININNLIYYFKFNKESCFNSKTNLFLAFIFYSNKSYSLDYLPNPFASALHKKNYTRIKKINK